jgi:hypothetical protein
MNLRVLKVGKFVAAMDNASEIYMAQIKKIEKNKYTVRYCGWTSEHDETIPIERIFPLTEKVVSKRYTWITATIGSSKHSIESMRYRDDGLLTWYVDRQWRDVYEVLAKGQVADF